MIVYGELRYEIHNSAKIYFQILNHITYIAYISNNNATNKKYA